MDYLFFWHVLCLGFEECQETYNAYPDALLCIRYINEVGKMIVGTATGDLDPGEVKEGDHLSEASHRLIDEAIAEQEEEQEVSKMMESLFLSDMNYMFCSL